ncbi:MAG: NADH-quinone oxidoreductase subunit L [Acidobacteria bacterium]|nr:MAG: NADH-quinone oxidoreductase subunit L [Acidobacteriota bacterium]
MLKLIWLIPLLPFAGFVVNGLLGKRFLSRRVVATIACGTVLAAFLLSVGAVWQLNDADMLARAAASAGPGVEVNLEQRRYEVTLWQWLSVGEARDSAGRPFDLVVGWGFQLDPLASLLLLVVTGVGFLIHIYSLGYMAHEEGFARFFSYMNLFMGMMLVLVLAANFLVMFVGWEGVGLCSYLLIGFFYQRPFDLKSGLTCADAGRKAFLVNRIGDFGFLLGVLLILMTFGSLDFSTVTEMASAQAGLLPPALMTLIAVLLFVGATGKSAQIPLFVWLPDAMAGPTPVSALIHAATMVTAGVYMVCRTSALFAASPAAMITVATIGMATAVAAAIMGLAQNDIKKVLAYSTVSQLGYMFVAAGVGAYGAAMFHLMTHAFFKALLFLGAGAVIHSLSGEQDMRRMGGMRRIMPGTFGVMLIASLAIAGVPGLAGFFSKDEILWRAFGYVQGPGFSGHPVLWALGALAAGLTAFYMFRLMFMVFWGQPRMTDDVRSHAHEAPRVMLVPLLVLAVLAAVGGYVGVPAALGGANRLKAYLAPSFTHLENLAPGGPAGSAIHHGEALTLEYGLMAVSVAMGLAGILLAWLFYVKRPDLPGRFTRLVPRSYTFVAEKFYVDELYRATVVGGFFLMTRLSNWFDRWIVDGLVNLIRHVTVASAHVSYFFDRYAVDLLVNAIGWITRGLFHLFRRFQTGLVQTYAAGMVFGLFVLVSLYLLVSAGN